MHAAWYTLGRLVAERAAALPLARYRASQWPTWLAVLGRLGGREFHRGIRDAR